MRHLFFLMTATFWLGIMLPAQIPNPLSRGKKSNSASTTGVEPAFNKEAYLNLVHYAEGIYNQREAFRFMVDREYEEQVRKDASKAHFINLHPTSEIIFVLEDRYRQFSGLYDNLLMQDVVNKIGQEVVPKWADRLVTFKVLADPVPRAEAISTGTVYVSTGLVAMMDNKAQLAYVLAHEAAHVVKDHWKTRAKVRLAKSMWEAEAEENKRNMQAWGTLVGMGVGAASGAAGGRTAGTATFGMAVGGIAGNAIASYLIQSPSFDVEWNRIEEDEADEIANETLLEMKLDVRQIPAMYVAMDKMALRNTQSEMGFWGSRGRMKERLEKVRAFIQEKIKPDETLIGSNPEFRTLIAELKRDNGILAYYQDMLDMARANLEQAASVRNPDPNTLYYYGKILKATARTDEERAKALKQFELAMQRDKANHVYGAYLHTAVSLVDGTSTDKARVKDYLEEYVDRYSEAKRADRRSTNDLPPHMDTLADYLHRAGIENWKFSDAPKQRAASNDETVPAQIKQVSAPAQPAVVTPPPPAPEEKKRATPKKK